MSNALDSVRKRIAGHPFPLPIVKQLLRETLRLSVGDIVSYYDQRGHVMGFCYGIVTDVMTPPVGLASVKRGQPDTSTDDGTNSPYGVFTVKWVSGTALKYVGVAHYAGWALVRETFTNRVVSL